MGPLRAGGWRLVRSRSLGPPRALAAIWAQTPDAIVDKVRVRLAMRAIKSQQPVWARACARVRACLCVSVCVCPYCAIPVRSPLGQLSIQHSPLLFACETHRGLARGAVKEREREKNNKQGKLGRKDRGPSPVHSARPP